MICRLHLFVLQLEIDTNQSDIPYVNFRLVGSHAIYSFVSENNNRKSKIMVMNNKGTNAYTTRNFRRIKKNADTRIACVHFTSASFAYLRVALYFDHVPYRVRVKHFSKMIILLLLIFYFRTRNLPFNPGCPP